MWNALIPVLGNLFERVIPDPKVQEEAKLKMLEMAQNGELAKLTAETELAKGQMEINKVEASAPDFFSRGWRPSVGWCCSLGLAYQFLIRPVLTGFGHPMPALETDTLLTLLFGILGLGAYRTTEKIKGVTR
jgi:hypothetical protein